MRRMKFADLHLIHCAVVAVVLQASLGLCEVCRRLGFVRDRDDAGNRRNSPSIERMGVSGGGLS